MQQAFDMDQNNRTDDQRLPKTDSIKNTYWIPPKTGNWFRDLFETRRVPAVLSDFSINGACLVSEESPEIGDFIHFDLIFGRFAPIRIRGRVRHSSIIELSNDALDRVQRMREEYSEMGYDIGELKPMYKFGIYFESMPEDTKRQILSVEKNLLLELKGG